MLVEHNLTEARKGFSALYNSVFNSLQPAIISRNSSQEVLMLRADLQKAILSAFALQPEVIHEADGSVTLLLDHLDLYANADSLEEARQELVRDLKAYAQDYIERAQLFLNAPNRRGHFPYVLRVLLCNSEEEIVALLEAQLAT